MYVYNGILFVGWDFYRENIGTDRIVARLKNKRDENILEVYETSKGYKTRAFQKGIDNIEISYSQCKKLLTDAELKLNYNDRLHKQLNNACFLIEKDYIKQVESLVFQFN